MPDDKFHGLYVSNEQNIPKKQQNSADFGVKEPRGFQNKISRGATSVVASAENRAKIGVGRFCQNKTD